MRRVLCLSGLVMLGAVSITAGKTVDQIASSWSIPSKYAGYAPPQPDRLKTNVQLVYDELK